MSLHKGSVIVAAAGMFLALGVALTLLGILAALPGSSSAGSDAVAGAAGGGDVPQMVPSSETPLQELENGPQDHWATDERVGGQTYHTLTIPADFFVGQTEAFETTIYLKGDPINPGTTGTADTVINRDVDPVLPGDPTGHVGAANLEIVELSLVSVNPITVPSTGDEWDVEVGLSPTAPPTGGTLTATKTHANGGTFDSTLYVQPLLTFTKVGDPGQVLALDTADEGMEPLEFTATNAPFVHTLGSHLTAHVYVGPGTSFIVGVHERDPGNLASQIIRWVKEQLRWARHRVTPPRPPGAPSPPPLDYLATENRVGGQTYHTLTIPGDFFGDGGASFEVTIYLEGEPIHATSMGTTDTVVERSADPVAAADPSGNSGTVELEVIELNLRSVKPVEADNGDEWDVQVGLSSTPPDTAGSMDATKTHANGGTFDSTLYVQPLLTFTKVGSDPPEVLELDTAEYSMAPLAFEASGAPFVNNLSGDLTGKLYVDSNTEFIVGVHQRDDGDLTSQIIRWIVEQLRWAKHRAIPAFQPLIVPSPVDYWETDNSDNSDTSEDFSNEPIPADFFGSGSDPFTGTVAYKGEPLHEATTGSTDTVIERSADPFELADLPGGDPVTVDVEIIALNLRSVDPITVTYDGGTGTDEQWDVQVDVSPTPPGTAGSLTATKTHGNGGTFHSTLYVQALLTFTKVGSDPPEVLELDTAEYDMEPLELRVEPEDDAHFVNELGEHVKDLVVAPPGAKFIPGIEEADPGDITSQIIDDILERLLWARHLVRLPLVPCHAVAWASVRGHGGAGELAIELDASAEGNTATCETRRDGVLKIVVDFGADVSACYTAGQVSVSGGLSVVGEALVDGGTKLEIDVDGSVDAGCYTIDVGASVSCLVGDTDCEVRTLAGNTNGDMNTNLIDMAQTKSKNGQDPTVPGDARFDVNTDGNINLIDMALVKSLNGNSVSCP